MWIKKEIKEFQYGGKPVQTILEIRLNQIAHHQILKDKLTQDMFYFGKAFNFHWYSHSENMSDIPNSSIYYISREGHTDQVKATVMSHFFQDFNKTCKAFKTESKDNDGHIDFLLSHPIGFLSTF